MCTLRQVLWLLGCSPSSAQKHRPFEECFRLRNLQHGCGIGILRRVFIRILSLMRKLPRNSLKLIFVPSASVVDPSRGIVTCCGCPPPAGTALTVIPARASDRDKARLEETITAIIKRTVHLHEGIGSAGFVRDRKFRHPIDRVHCRQRTVFLDQLFAAYPHSIENGSCLVT